MIRGRAWVIPIIERLANANNLTVIDLYHQMQSQGSKFFPIIFIPTKKL